VAGYHSLGAERRNGRAQIENPQDVAVLSQRCRRAVQPPPPARTERRRLAAAAGRGDVGRVQQEAAIADGKENISPGVAPRKAKKMNLSSDHDQSAGPGEVAGYRRPDFASATLFDPDLLAEFRRAVDAYEQALEASKRRDDDVNGGEEDGAGVAADPLEPFERQCPPGGEGAVVLYTTSLRGVRRTFEDCARVRRLLECLRVAFLERDVSMHAAYREELRALLPLRTDDGAAAFPVPPRLFVDGRVQRQSLAP
jgi:glutaredoxin domain-containing cysteine-rich protein 1